MAELIAYASRTGTRRNLDALRGAGWRLLVAAAGVQRTEGFEHVGLDNSAWSMRETGDYPPPLKRLFIKLVTTLGPNADWAVPPDIVAGGKRSLELSMRWLSWVLDHCPRALIAVQDGMVADDVAPNLCRRIGIFVGGSTPWKLETMAMWADLARCHGAWCHVARVNSVKRIKKCALAGATSFDGSSVSRYAVTLPELNREVVQQFFVLEDK